MTTSIRVAALAELPPGKGKIFDLGDRRVTVYNLDGQLRATAARQGRVAHQPFTDTRSECPHQGLIFDVFAEDSPVELAADTRCLAVRVTGQSVWLDLADD